MGWSGRGLERVTVNPAVWGYAEDHPRLDQRERAFALLLLNRHPSRWREMDEAFRQHDRARSDFVRASRTASWGRR